MNFRTVNLTILVVIIFLLLSGCIGRVERPASIPSFPLTLMSMDSLPPFTDDLDQQSLEVAISNSLRYYERIPEETIFRFGEKIYIARELKESLLSFLDIIRNTPPGKVREERIRSTFDVYKSAGCSENRGALFTGYYEPVLRGSLRKTERYKYPIYRKPDDSIVVDLGKFKEKFEGELIVARFENGQIFPYYTREEIDKKRCLENRGLEIAWLEDPVDVFFLHIQGSGTIVLPDGGLVQVGYAGSNGRPYRSIGKRLLDEGKFPEGGVSLRSIRRYLKEHPEEMSDILNHNESYVFFRIVEKGPVGCLGVTLTRGRSIATDSRLYPKGALAFIRAKKPLLDGDGNIKAWIPFSRYVMNQDTGGAITGPGRVDLFCGTGKEAGNMAGHLKEDGELYFFVKKKICHQNGGI